MISIKPQKESCPESKDGFKQVLSTIKAQEYMQLQDFEMAQLREQLRLNGIPVNDACLEVRVLPDPETSPLPPSRNL